MHGQNHIKFIFSILTFYILYYLLTSGSRVLEKLTRYILCYSSIKIFSWTHFKMFVTLLAVNKETIFLIREKNIKSYFYMQTWGGFDIIEYYNFSTWILSWEEI